jgi:tubulin-specific chaperone D
MAEAFKHGDQTKQCVQIFELTDQLRESTLKGYGNDILLEASCFLLSSSISQEALALRPDIGVEVVPRWRFILDFSLRHRNDKVQEAAARTVGVLGRLRSSEDDADR